MLNKLRAASAQIDRFTGRSFAPQIATRKFDWRTARTLLFRGYDLLELTTLTNGDGSVISPAAIITLGGIGGPVVGVELDIAQAMFVYQTTRTRALSVTGVWGWHDEYTSAWKPSSDSIPGGGITSSATSFTVSSVSGSDGWGLSPRFSPGQLIIVDSEYMHVIVADSATNTLTVVRGANGSSATTHSAGTAISIYTPPADIQEIALRWAAWLYKQEDSGDFSGQVGQGYEESPFPAPGVPAAAIPPDLLATLRNLRRTGGAV
jgi:hypothetical protein